MGAVSGAVIGGAAGAAVGGAVAGVKGAAWGTLIGLIFGAELGYLADRKPAPKGPIEVKGCKSCQTPADPAPPATRAKIENARPLYLVPTATRPPARLASNLRPTAGPLPIASTRATPDADEGIR
jgi:hypothetical protein